MKRFQWLLVLIAIVTAASLAPVVLAGAPTGSSPYDPLPVTGAWQTLASNTSAWFHFDYTGDKSKIHVFLDDNDTSNVDLGVFTPTLAKKWLQDQTTAPIGRGAKPNTVTIDSVHDLIWHGGSNEAGRYFAVVTNNNPTPVSIRVTVVGENVALAPTPTPTPGLVLVNPFTTPVPTGTIQGHLLFQEASGGSIYTVNGDGSNLTRVADGIDPAWSPDGQSIAFARWTIPAGLYIAKADGSNERLFFGKEQARSPQWSADGTQLAFYAQKGGSLDDHKVCYFANFCYTFPADPHFKLGVVNINTGAFFEPRCSTHCFSPTWNTDNYTIAFADAAIGILRTDTNSGAESVLYNQNPVVQSPRYSPDGSRIAFQVRAHNHWEISVMNADGSNVSAVTSPDPLGFNIVNNVAPTWSPDGKQILFLSDRTGKWEFFVANVDGSNLKQVLKNVTNIKSIHYNNSSERVIDWSK
jgi:hypothetical protein